MTNENNKLKTIGAFLKSRRNRLQPEQVGFRSSQGQRRTPGLRREEVAMLANVSATYYTWLEQGRKVTASKEIMENIGKALQLTPDERIHLLQLWNPNKPDVISSIDTKLNQQWHNIIEQLTYPSFISNDRCEVLTWNRAANEIIADFASLSPPDRVMIRLMFVDPEFRRRLINWEEFAMYSVAVFRTYCDKHQDDSYFEEMVVRLCQESAEFETMWKLHNIQLKKVSRVFFQIPDTANSLTFDINSFTGLAENPDLHICIYTPVLEIDTVS